MNTIKQNKLSSSFYCNKGMTERKPTNDKNTNRNIRKKEIKIVSGRLITVISTSDSIFDIGAL